MKKLLVGFGVGLVTGIAIATLLTRERRDRIYWEDRALAWREAGEEIYVEELADVEDFEADEMDGGVQGPGGGEP